MSNRIVRRIRGAINVVVQIPMFCSWFIEIRGYANRRHAISHRFEQTYAITITTTDKRPPPFRSLSPAVAIDCTSVVYASIGYIGYVGTLIARSFLV